MGCDIFVSYARATTQPVARRLRDDLQAAGLTVFLDEREIPFGAAFPAEIARGLLDARVVVILADETYLRRPWCVHELRLITAAWRAGDSHALSGVVVGLPAGGALETVTAQLPPPLAAASWPSLGAPEALAGAVIAAASIATTTARTRLEALNDDTTRVMLSGADQPLAWSASAGSPSSPASPIWMIEDAPSTRGDGFIGRAPSLWTVVNECITARAFTPARRVVLQGLGGCGKSLLASEFVARYARRFFSAGVVWVDAEAGADGLVQTWSALWRQIAPGVPAPDDSAADAQTRLRQLAGALRERLQNSFAAGELLWVIDGLPERGAIEDWCPAPLHVTLLATTRRADTLRETDAVVRLGPLADSAALTLLTRAPVDPGWMSETEWQAVVRWVGALPLVLSVLRESLLDGSLSVDALRRAPKAEPAAEADRLMDGLRGEVDDISLRGAAEAFDLSWQALTSDVDLANAARRVALLAPVSLTEPMLEAVAGSALVGKLVRRGWLQPGGSGARAFTLHRVPASVLRMKIDSPDATFAGMFDALVPCVSFPREDWERARVELHADVVIRRLFQLAKPGAVAETLPAARRFCLAAAGVDHRERRGLRYLAAGLAQAIGAGEEFVAALRANLDDQDASAVESLPHTLQALPGCESAVRWMCELLTDPRDRIRWQALVHAPAVRELLEPVLKATLAEKDEPGSYNVGSSIAQGTHFEAFLEKRLLRTAMSHLLSAQSEGDATVRRRTHSLLGSALEIHGRAFEAGGFTGAQTIRHLLHFAMADEDATVRKVAATAAARGANPVDDIAWRTLCEAVASRAGAEQILALEAVEHFLVAARKPPAPRGLVVERDDEGRMVISGALPSGSNWPPQVVPQLISWVLTLPADSSLQAARALMADKQGLAETAPWVHARLDAQDFEPVARLCDALCAVRPDFVNAPWWRAQARLALGDYPGARADLETVTRLAPEFSDARQRLGETWLQEGRASFAQQAWEEAAAQLRRALEFSPEDVNAHHLLAACCVNSGMPAEAESEASRVISLYPEQAQAWYFRAIARSQLERFAEARDDAARAAELAPEDAEFTRYHAELKDWCARH